MCSLQTTSLNNIKYSWEEELVEEIYYELWEGALTICAQHGLIQCELIHRAHWTKARLSKMYKDVNPCNQSSANHVHMFWCCPSLVGFWKDIFNTLSELSGTQIETDPCIA
jgi:hypothetical protein